MVELPCHSSQQQPEKMADPPELAAHLMEKERDVIDILLSLPELIADFRVYGENQLVTWGWKKRRSAVYSPLTPFPSPSPSPSTSPSLELENLKPRVAHTKEQFLREINSLTQRKKEYQQEQLLQQISVLTQRKKVYQQELLKIQHHLEKQIKFNNILKELTAGATTLAPSQTLFVL